jgi:hypothetical protein
MIIRPEAEADLVSARNWYERQHEGLGAAFLLCVEEVLEHIGRTPERSVTSCQHAKWARSGQEPASERSEATENLDGTGSTLMIASNQGMERTR